VSFLLGLLAIWLVELFARTPAPPATTTVVVPQPWFGPALPANTPALLGGGAVDAGQHPVPQLTAQQALPRELTQEEVGALLAAADDQGLALCALMLLGLTVDEVRVLTVGDFNPSRRQLAVRGASARELALPDWLAKNLTAVAPTDPQWPLFHATQDESVAASEIATLITYAALDAGLEEPTAVTPEALRHTFILHLLRHNVRFAQIPPLAGHLTSEELKAYAQFTSGARQGNACDVDPVMPALRDFPKAATT
jgi:integrase